MGAGGTCVEQHKFLPVPEMGQHEHQFSIAAYPAGLASLGALLTSAKLLWRPSKRSLLCDQVQKLKERNRQGLIAWEATASDHEARATSDHEQLNAGAEVAALRARSI